MRKWAELFTQLPPGCATRNWPLPYPRPINSAQHLLGLRKLVMVAVILDENGRHYYANDDKHDWNVSKMPVGRRCRRRRWRIGSVLNCRCRFLVLSYTIKANVTFLLVSFYIILICCILFDGFVVCFILVSTDKTLRFEWIGLLDSWKKFI